MKCWLTANVIYSLHCWSFICMPIWCLMDFCNVQVFFGSFVEHWTHWLLFMSHEVPSRLNTVAKLVQNKQLWRQSGISLPYHKGRFSSFRLHRIKLPSTRLLFLLVRGLSAQKIMCTFSIGLCIQYTIIDLLRSHSIHFISINVFISFVCGIATFFRNKV